MANQRFEEIDVERINIVEADGTRRFALTNEQRFPDPVIFGRTFTGRQGTGTAGFIYYNDDGTEMGGFAFGGGRERGGHGASLTFDGFEKDQCMGLFFADEDETYHGGLVFQDQPRVPLLDVVDDQERVLALDDGPDKDQAMRELQEKYLVAERLRVGRADDGSVGVYLSDSKGRPRLRVAIGADDEPRIEFLDAEGTVTFTLPPS